jgi:hypothetical protein
MGNRKETPFFGPASCLPSQRPPARGPAGSAVQPWPRGPARLPLPHLGLAWRPSCGLPRAPRGPAASPLRAPRHPRAVGAAAVLPCGAHPVAASQNCPLPLPSLTPRAHDPLLPTSRDRPYPIPASPTAAAAVRPSAVSPGPPSLSLPRPLLPSAWCCLGARRRALGARPWRLWRPTPRGSRRWRSPTPARGDPGPPVPAPPPPRPGLSTVGHGAAMACPTRPPASAAARLGLAGPGAPAPALPRRPARPARPSHPCPFLTRGPGSTSTAVAHGPGSPAMALAPALPGVALPLSPCAVRSRPLAPASSPARPRRPGASPASRSHPRGPAWWRGAAS